LVDVFYPQFCFLSKFDYFPLDFFPLVPWKERDGSRFLSFSRFYDTFPPHPWRTSSFFRFGFFSSPPSFSHVKGKGPLFWIEPFLNPPQTLKIFPCLSPPNFHENHFVPQLITSFFPLFFWLSLAKCVPYPYCDFGFAFLFQGNFFILFFFGSDLISQFFSLLRSLYLFSPEGQTKCSSQSLPKPTSLPSNAGSRLFLHPSSFRSPFPPTMNFFFFRPPFSYIFRAS